MNASIRAFPWAKACEFRMGDLNGLVGWPGRQRTPSRLIHVPFMPHSTLFRHACHKPQAMKTPIRSSIHRLVAPLALISLQVLGADPAEPPAYRRLGIQGEVGTTGPGVSIAYRFMDHVGARAGISYFHYSLDGALDEVDYRLDLRALVVPLTLDIYPWSSKSFRISVGGALNWSQLEGTSTGLIQLEGEEYNGNINVGISPPRLNPYVGIGGNLLYFDRAKRWALSGEIGVLYCDWEVRMTGSGTPTDPKSPPFQVNLAEARDSLQKSVRQLPLWPVVKLGISYSF